LELAAIRKCRLKNGEFDKEEWSDLWDGSFAAFIGTDTGTGTVGILAVLQLLHFQKE
jgi:hypothetical protein